MGFSGIMEFSQSSVILLRFTFQELLSQECATANDNVMCEQGAYVDFGLSRMM